MNLVFPVETYPVIRNGEMFCLESEVWFSRLTDLTDWTDLRDDSRILSVPSERSVLSVNRVRMPQFQ